MGNFSMSCSARRVKGQEKDEKGGCGDHRRHRVHGCSCLRTNRCRGPAFVTFSVAHTRLYALPKHDHVFPSRGGCFQPMNSLVIIG
ncbi:hypothetical protein Hypma_009498 [Hypsizygus marmoreus]|uniref:Uncharacterized protein n=1 Tax=Hypsizygus marmoreus TaxID=39966 RepID=A0A369JQ92_HYPMA|nr:hypothetical protein Hypma_009498 [Hypsizygus marmoreus]